MNITRYYPDGTNDILFEAPPCPETLIQNIKTNQMARTPKHKISNDAMRRIVAQKSFELRNKYGISFKSVVIDRQNNQIKATGTRLQEPIVVENCNALIEECDAISSKYMATEKSCALWLLDRDGHFPKIEEEVDNG